MTRLPVAVVIPTRNRARLLKRALDSVVTQRELPTEIVIVDDGSSDDTQTFLEQYIDSHNSIVDWKLLDSGGQGVAHARNQGWSIATQPWVAFLDSDDAWHKDKLSHQFSYLKRFQGYRLIHNNEIWIHNGKQMNQSRKHRKSGGDLFIRSLDLCLISPSAVLMRKDLLEQFRGFDPDFTVCEDYELWLRVTAHEPLGFIDQRLTIKYGGHKDQLSQTYLAMDWWRIKAMLQLDQDCLNLEQKLSLTQTLVQKASILATGFEKHQRPRLAKLCRDLALAFRDSQNQHEQCRLFLAEPPPRLVKGSTIIHNNDR